MVGNELGVAQGQLTDMLFLALRVKSVCNYISGSLD